MTQILYYYSSAMDFDLTGDTPFVPVRFALLTVGTTLQPENAVDTILERVRGRHDRRHDDESADAFGGQATKRETNGGGDWQQARPPYCGMVCAPDGSVFQSVHFTTPATTNTALSRMAWPRMRTSRL